MAKKQQRLLPVWIKLYVELRQAIVRMVRYKANLLKGML